MPVAQRLTTLHVCDKSIDISHYSGLIRCESEFRRQIEHGLFSFPFTRAIVVRGEPPRRSSLTYNMRGFRTYLLLAHSIGRHWGKVKEAWRGEEGPPLMRRPSADAVAGNGAP